MTFALHPADYPPTRRDDVVDDVHGQSIADPYRWLEDTAAPDTAAWIAAQNQLTESLLAKASHRDEMRRQLEVLWNRPRAGVPFERGGRWFQLRNTGLQAQSVLWVSESLDDPGAILLDPNLLSDDGTVALVDVAVSGDGRLLAYATSGAGSDWMTWRVREVDTGVDRADVLEWSKFSTAVWSPEATTLHYSVLEAPVEGRAYLEQTRTPRIVRHRLGADPASAEVVFHAADQPEWIPHLASTDDGRYAVVVVSRGTFPESQLHVLDLDEPAHGMRALVGNFDQQVSVVGNVGSTFYLRTNRDAERGRIVAVDLADVESWRTVVDESADTLVDARLIGGRFVVHYLHHAQSVLRVFALDGTHLEDIALPGICSVTAIAGHADRPTVTFGVTSFVEHESPWVHDLSRNATRRLDSGTTRKLATSGEPPQAAADVLTTEQVFVRSDDGAELPVFLVHRADVTPSGDVPVLLYGYGGFNIATTPAWRPAHALWAQRGGLLAVACLRGGGEYGRAWHDAGRLAHKQNVFDDFCTVARWLVDAGWTSSRRVAISGGSNGGLLVGACLTQHPELFGAATAKVGVFDMLRFPLFTVGWAWTSDYGDPAKADDARTLLAYSPLHNVRKGATYPPTLIQTGDHDDRVAPGHSFKFAAALQAAQAGAAPVLIRVETSAGHGAGKPTQKQIDEDTDMLTFLEEAVAI